METDLEIARSKKPRPIAEVAADLGLSPEDIEPYGKDKAKIGADCLLRLLADNKLQRGKLVVVTAITPTKAGEGKTTVSIGLAQALSLLGERTIACLRQPSLGPVFGLKGGAAGGGRAQVLPMEDVNLHFTGDMHAVSAANNLLAAMTDNHIYHGNALGIDSRSVFHRRVVDMNDRSLRQTVIALGGKENGYPREASFEITAASEVMAILSLADSYADLKSRLASIVVAHDHASEPVTACQLGAEGAMSVLLREAFKPNLIQTLEGTPVFMHGGPFANIAHGCSSVVATKAALKLGEIVVTEGGFGADLGFEKFCDIVAFPRLRDLCPDAAVLVVTARALKLHGGAAPDNLNQENLEAVKAGLDNLDRHAQIIEKSGLPKVIAINRFSTDTKAEIDLIQEHCCSRGLRSAVCDAFARGAEGGHDLALAVKDILQYPASFAPFYDLNGTIGEKLSVLVRDVYGGAALSLSPQAHKQEKWLSKHGFDRLPVCVAKTQYSFSDDPSRLGAPRDFTMHVTGFHLRAGAGFVVALIGDINTMPGLPRHPSALHMDIDERGRILSLN